MKPKPVRVVLLILFLVVFAEGLILFKKNQNIFPKPTFSTIFDSEEGKTIHDQLITVKGEILVYDEVQSKLVLQLAEGRMTFKLRDDFKIGYGRGANRALEFQNQTAMVYYLKKGNYLEAVSMVVY